MSTEFNGKKLLVIGGTSGMGLQTARMVLEQGGSVVIVGHREDKAEEARKALSSEPDGAAAISRDVPVARASHSEAKGIPVAALVALRERLAAALR